MSQEEDDYWTSRILEARRGQLDTVRKAAGAWSAVFTGVLGIFGTVTFVGGLNGLADLVEPLQTYARVGVLLAAGCTLVATILSALAANSFPVVSNDLTVDSFQARNKERAQEALKRLRLSMGFGSAAAVLVLAGSAMVLLSQKEENEDPVTLIAVVDGKVVCGELQLDEGGLTIRGFAGEAVTAFTVVTACPSE